jgi:hypothetical protein
VPTDGYPSRWHQLGLGIQTGAIVVVSWETRAAALHKHVMRGRRQCANNFGAVAPAREPLDMPTQAPDHGADTRPVGGI